jgi:hypothetical protein
MPDYACRLGDFIYIGGLINVKDKIVVKIDEFVTEAPKREFKSGNFGFGFYGKIIIDGQPYQVSLNVVQLNK